MIPLPILIPVKNDAKNLAECLPLLTGKPRPIPKCRGGIPPVDDILNRSQFCVRVRLR